MWITGAILSISQRSLLPEGPLSTTQRRAQELSQLLIQSHASKPASAAALAFIQEHNPDFQITGLSYLTVPLSSSPLPSLGISNSYGVKGGAARELLTCTLKIRPFRQPRDIDLVRRGHYLLPQDNEIARRVMPKDFELGARVELIRDISAHLASRDLTINETAAFDSTLYASLLCALDTLGNVIRPSRYRSGTLHRRPHLLGLSLLKMVRLYAEGAVSGENWLITGLPEEVSFSEFDLAIHLNKAFQRGRNVAEKFLRSCELLSLLPASNDPIYTALSELAHLRYGERGLFPDVPQEEWLAVVNRR